MGQRIKMSWQDDKNWSDGLLNEIKSILGLYLIGEATKEDDQEKCTDLIVLKMEAVRIACRIRRHQYYLNREYRNQFTLRASRPSGMKTELAKIIEGWGDFFFYGFSQDDACSLAGYTLCDLKVFRTWHSSYLVRNHGILPGLSKNNSDNSSSFYVFNWNDLPANIIVSQKLN
jgi:hypothetical protein